MKQSNLIYKKIESPVGPLYLVADETHLHALIFQCNWSGYAEKRTLTKAESPILNLACLQIGEYFAGQRKRFDLPYRLEGTEFQKKVWTALAKIPYGKTVSYGEQARSIGNPKAVRAVGGTNGLNPISIIVPCHRVIGASGKLTGYGGGILNKEFLLKLEGIDI